MILRILGEGQLEVEAESLHELNELDEALINAVDKGDEALFRSCLSNLVNRVRQVGRPVPADHLGPSEFILPGEDATLEEVRGLLSEEGLIPG
ncbi:MAG TPA: hypothetical protein VHL53_03565 [Acidimicrobiia bacterium]|nr:hypothetical protein [Acidimicrobiia bacterium]